MIVAGSMIKERCNKIGTYVAYWLISGWNRAYRRRRKVTVGTRSLSWTSQKEWRMSKTVGIVEVHQVGNRRQEWGSQMVAEDTRFSGAKVKGQGS